MNDLHAAVAVYGAGGHTGRFVVDELQRRAIPVIAVGRDAARLPAGVPARLATIDDADALDRAFAGAAVVINCAGPFLDTAAPVIAAALRTGAHYLDVTAEQASALATFEQYDAAARAAGVSVIPAAGFYGGLADLLASALIGTAVVDDIITAVALDHWWPTEGTRKTGERNKVPRVIIDGGQVVPLPLPAASLEWPFAAPHGRQDVVEMPFSEIITLSRHLPARSIRSYLGANALGDVRDAGTSAPTPVDATGRSAQQFAMEVVVTDADGSRRASARGQDIYAVSAPLVVEAAARLRDPAHTRSGALSLGQAFDARDFLHALSPDPLAVSFAAA